MARATPDITNRELNRALLARQMLLAREKTSASDAIARLVGMQAQVPKPPFVGLWTRLESFRRDELLHLLHERRVVRATVMRGTIHLMTAKDYVGLRATLQPGLTRGMQSLLRERAKALDLEALDAIARKFFAKPATFDDLRKHFKKKDAKADERAMALAIRYHVPLVQVPSDAAWGFPGSADFAVADTWLGKKVPIRDAPADKLVLRYLGAFGPATSADAQAWSGLQGLHDVFEKLRPRLVTFRDERKRELFDLPDAPRPGADTPAPVRFIPEYDNLVLAHEDRGRIVADEHRSRIVSKNLQVRSTFLEDGMVAGAWKIERKGKTATLVMEPFEKIDRKAKTALEEEGEALLDFAEEDAEVRAFRW